ncbi:MAG TPA: 50S ribosomal protein L22 [Acidimicrobiia bacterium]|jgi:large subunit ribosomal protein L22|nr:50S ribosomal protein L22 [Acidimicrobiia bacterium]HIL05448.1 50S ribosomal protein L22 [Acidimicrobiia bacterium]
MSGLIDLDTIAGARSTHKFARLSASKVRVVLDLIRDEDLEQARDELRFCDRGAATIIAKVLESAVANAENNEHLSADELYVAECWADEGPTLKRWRPRARGRATRINKRTCHITVVVAQLDEDELETRAARLAAAGRRSADADRAARVAGSKGPDEETDENDVATIDEEVVNTEGATDDVAEETADNDTTIDQTETSEEVLSDVGEEDVAEVETSDKTEASDEAADNDEKEA